MKNLTIEQKKELNKFIQMFNNVINVFIGIYCQWFYRPNDYELPVIEQFIILNSLDKLVFKIPDIFKTSELYYYFGEDESDGLDNNNLLIDVFGQRLIKNNIVGAIELSDYINNFKRLLNDYQNKLNLTTYEKERIKTIQRNFERFTDYLKDCKIEIYENIETVQTIEKIFDIE